MNCVKGPPRKRAPRPRQKRKKVVLSQKGERHLPPRKDKVPKKDVWD